MAITIISDNPQELLAAHLLLSSGSTSVNRFIFEKNNIPTNLNVDFRLLGTNQISDILEIDNNEII